MASTQRTSVTSRNVSQQRPVYLMPKQELIDVVGRNPRNHPKHLDVAEALCKEQRKKLHARYLGGPHSPAVGAMTKLRVADYERETITSDVNHAVRSRSISKWESQGTAEKGDDGSLSGTPYTSTDCIAEIVGNCRCVTPVQGGAVLWTGEMDGSIALRNGLTGEITKVLPPVELKRRKRSSGNGDSLSTAEVIFSVLGHAFVGYSDGMIRIYDTLVVTLVQESKTPHESSIAFFDQLSNGSVVAVSCNGQITLFDDYNQELADRENIFYPVRLTSWIELANSESVTAITACGSRSVIVGTSMGHIHSLDCQDLGLDVSFNVPKNNGQVTALCRANGLLFVGTECGNILVYKLNDLEPDRQPLFLRSLEYHKQTSDDETIAKVSIVSFDNDANGHRLWSLDRTGRICNFDAVVETDFVLRVGPSNVSGGLPVRSMASVCHLDVLRLWALTSSGRNMLYTAEFDRTGYETDQVLVSMQEIINRDTQEINSWTANVTQIQSTNMKQRQRAVDVLQRLQQEGLHIRYFGRWIRHIYILRTERKRSRYAVSLVRNTQCDLLRIAYLRWLHLWQAHHEQKMKKAVEAYIAYSARSERQRQFLSCLERHARERKDREGNLSHIADTLCFAHNDRIRRLCFSKLHTYSCMHQHTRKRKYLAIALEGNAKNIMLRDYYYKMMHFMAARRVSRSKQEAAVAMCHATDNTLRRRCFGRLQRNAGTSALRRRKERLSHLLLQNSDYGLRSLFFHRWLEDASARTVERKEQEIRQRKMALAELEAQFITVEGGVHRSTLVQQHEADIAVLEQQKRDRADRLMQMEAYVQSLEHEVLQRERLLSSSTSRRQLFLDAMSRLKSRVLNFDADYELIGKTIERTTGAPVKTFQVIFHEIRKVLVAHLGEQPSFRKIGTSAPLDSMRYTWGGTDAEIRSSVMQKIPASVHAQMIESVKRLAIAFDLMQPMEDEEIDIEPEVAINARGLIAMYECLVDHRQRKSLQKQPSLIAA